MWRDARERGATIHMGGGRNPDLAGLYYQPTVMTGVDNDMVIMREETFGPVLCIQKVRDEAEAIRLANDSDYGLNGNVWTRDKARGLALALQIDTGACSVNDMAVSYGIPAAPFGGRKSSGVGQVNGKKGLRGYCHENAGSGGEARRQNAQCLSLFSEDRGGNAQVHADSLGEDADRGAGCPEPLAAPDLLQLPLSATARP